MGERNRTSRRAGAATPTRAGFIASSLPPSRAQRRLAGGMVLAMLAMLSIIAGGFSASPVGRNDAFPLAYGVAMFLIDSITAVILFAQFSMLRARALLAIASGYSFAALMTIPWTLTFPGALSPDGMIGGLQSTPSIYFLWHAGFPAFAIAYALLKTETRTLRLRHRSVWRPVLASVAISAALVGAATLLVTAGHDLLPRVMLDSIRFVVVVRVWQGAVACLVSAAALLVIWRRRRSVLDLFLMVVLFGLVVEIALGSFSVAGRFSVGWYAGRILGVLSGSILLLVLLHEITTLYAQLLRAVMAQQHERAARLMTGDAVSASLAHEVNQPLSAMITNADAGLLWLDRPAPDLVETKSALERIVADGHRATAVIDSIRAIFKRDAPKRTLLNVNDLIWEALALVRVDLQTYGVSARAEPGESLPSIEGDHVQLQQVLLNLITNAIESMATADGARSLCVRSRLDASGGVTVAVEDSGPSLQPGDLDRVFDPLFTTKPHGMGMGLSICRSIVEAHEGRLWAAPNGARGAVFQFTLPASTEREQSRAGKGMGVAHPAGHGRSPQDLGRGR